MHCEKHFSGISHFIDYLNKPLPKDRRLRSSEKDKTNDPDPWSGAQTFEQAITYATQGKDIDKFSDLFNKASHLIGKGYQLQVFHDVCGAYVDVGAYLTGEPECMVDFSLQESNGKTVDLFIQTNDNCGTSAYELTLRGVTAMILADTLENTGIRCRIFAACYTDLKLNEREGKKGIITVMLKDYQDPLNLYLLSGNLAPSFLRRLYFKAYEIEFPETGSGNYGFSENITDTVINKLKLETFNAVAIGGFEVGRTERIPATVERFLKEIELKLDIKILE
jgi:hypothetical protein